MKALIPTIVVLAFFASPWHTVEANAAQSFEECYQERLVKAKGQHKERNAAKFCRNKQAGAADKTEKKK